MKDWCSVALPPDSCRDVCVKFGDKSEGTGFYWSHDKRWYQNKHHGAKRVTRIHPFEWKDKPERESN